MGKKVMDTKTKVFTVVMQILFDISLIAYVISIVTNRYETGINTFVTLAVVFYSVGNFDFSKKKPESESKIIDNWSFLNGILFAVMMAYEIIKIVI